MKTSMINSLCTLSTGEGDMPKATVGQCVPHRDYCPVYYVAIDMALVLRNASRRSLPVRDLRGEAVRSAAQAHESSGLRLYASVSSPGDKQIVRTISVRHSDETQTLRDLGVAGSNPAPATNWR